MKVIMGILGVIFGAGIVLMWYEMSHAPEMYYDGEGNLRPKEWFEENQKTEEMYYDYNCIERYNYEKMKEVSNNGH